MSEAEANKLKAEGNSHLQSGNYDRAISSYSEAIELCPKNHVLFSNRSAAYAKKGLHEESLIDAKKTVELAPNWGKGYSRLGTALTYLGRLAEAKTAFEKGLSFEPNNESLKSGLRDVEGRQASQASFRPPGDTPSLSPFSGPEVEAKLRSDPSTRSFMSDPSFLTILESLRSNPESLKLYINDPRVMQALGVILGVNVQMSEDMGAPKRNEEERRPPTSESSKKPEKKVSDEETKLTEQQQQASLEKQKGNEAYKKKDFETALAQYDKAFKLDPTNMAYLTNKAAVFYEQKKYDECVKQCEEAIEVGKSNRADCKLIAKAFARIGNAYAAQENYEQAKKFYGESLLEHRAPDVVKRMKQLDTAKKERERLAYLDADKANEERNLGNEFFSKGDYPEALKHYTESLKRNPDDERTYSNRAACYTKLAEFRLALKDCEDCIKKNPDFVKGYLRKGAALLALKENTKAAEAYQLALQLDPNCKEAKDGIYNSASARMSSNPEDRRKEVMNDPEVQSILMDPAMRMILEQMQEDPRAASEHLKNPVVAGKIQKLLEAGVLSMK